MKVKHIKVDIANKIVICLYVNTVSDTHNQKQPTTGKVFILDKNRCLRYVIVFVGRCNTHVRLTETVSSNII